MKRISKKGIEEYLHHLFDPDAAVDFAGTGWILTALNGEPPLPQTTITLDFVDGSRAAGSAGCNRYSTTYTQVEATPALSFGEMALTRKACVAEVMEQERVYLQALAGVSGFQLEDQELSLTDVDDVTVAAFSFVSQSLADSAWDVLSYNNGKGGVVSLVSGTSITAVFNADGTVSGSSGCNTYSGPYDVDGDTISFSPLAGTRKMCSGEGVMEQEAAYLAALATARTYRISGDRMEMRREDRALVGNFRRA